MTKDKNDIVRNRALRIDFVCSQCGEITVFYPNSRSNRNDNLVGAKSKYYQYLFCDVCKDKHEKLEKKRHGIILLQKEGKRVELDRLINMPYKEYLQTEHWKEVRGNALYRAKYKCQLCGNKDNLNVHHNTYENRGNEKDEDLIVLCQKCHGKFHDKFVE